MSDANATSSWNDASGTHHERRIRRVLRLGGLGLLVGVAVGINAFTYMNPAGLPMAVPKWTALALLIVCGGFPLWFSRSLDESILITLVAFVVGLGITVGAWIAPLWILSIPPVARDAILPWLTGRALSSGILVTPLAFLGAYFAAIFLDGYRT